MYISNEIISELLKKQGFQCRVEVEERGNLEDTVYLLMARTT